MAQDLAKTAGELRALMTASDWKSSIMSARYTERPAADRSAAVMYYQESNTSTELEEQWPIIREQTGKHPVE